MLLQKTFHLPALREVAQERLANLPSYRRQLFRVEQAVVSAEGSAHFVARLPGGFRGDVELVRVAGGNTAQILFRSSGGNVEMLGVLEYFQIRPSLTEVVLTLDYTICPWFYRWLDALGHCMDRFLNRQLEQVEAAFYGTSKTSHFREDPREQINPPPR
jgi:hypothetical protein